MPSIVHVKWAGRVLIPKEGASKMRKHGIPVAIGLDCKTNLETMCANLPEETTRCQCCKNASTALAGALIGKYSRPLKNGNFRSLRLIVQVQVEDFGL